MSTSVRDYEQTIDRGREVCAERGRHCGMPSPMTVDDRDIKDRLDLSESRAYDDALEVLGAYKLTGNFDVNLEIVLKNLGVLDKITYEIEPKSSLPYYPDCRHVVFRPTRNVHPDRFGNVVRSIKDRIGFDATLPWWGRLFR
jgi:hypothetical protein